MMVCRRWSSRTARGAWWWALPGRRHQLDGQRAAPLRRTSRTTARDDGTVWGTAAARVERRSTSDGSSRWVGRGFQGRPDRVPRRGEVRSPKLVVVCVAVAAARDGPEKFWSSTGGGRTGAPLESCRFAVPRSPRGRGVGEVARNHRCAACARVRGIIDRFSHH